MKNKYFILYGNCVLVDGFSRSLICDLYRNKYYYIPNDVYQLLQFCKNEFFTTVLESIGEDNKQIFLEYISYFIENDLGLYTNEPEVFPEISKEWMAPSKIITSIIDYNFDLDISNEKYKDFIEELSELNCKIVEIRIRDKVSVEQLDQLLLLFDGTRIRNISVYLLHSPEIVESLSDLTLRYKRIQTIFLCGSNEEKFEKVNNTNISFLKGSSLLPKSCGNINQISFSPSIAHYTEAQNHSTCLNRKVSIDYFGNIKNCPSSLESFGDFREVKIREALNNDQFQKNWMISKDKISVCKDCEYRYICTDCRVYRENPEDILSKPLKCGYNPYVGEWADWKNNKNKHKAFEFYDLQAIN